MWSFPAFGTHIPAEQPSALGVGSVPEEERGSARFELRYEEITQDGHVKLTALPHAIGRVCFGQLWARHPLLSTQGDGVLPMLTRLVIETEPTPTFVTTTVEAHGALQLAHECDQTGQVTGLFVNMFAEVLAPLGRSFGEQRPDAGRLVTLGRVFSEHTFTKPFAPAGQRKVLRLQTPGEPYLPETRYSRRLLPELLRVPSEGQLLDASLTRDVAPWSFGLTHTDNNQHVNSLVYARLFEDAALRRFAEHGQSTLLLAEAIEIVYRKPCFAGETLTCMLQTFKVGETLQAVGYLGPAGVAPERAHCAIRMRLRHGEPNTNGHTHAHPH